MIWIRMAGDEPTRRNDPKPPLGSAPEENPFPYPLGSDEADPIPYIPEMCEPDPDLTDAWDAADPRRQKDQMAPPAEPCECYCLHCGRVFMSDQMWFQRVINARDVDGFWRCPTPNCDGAGF